MTGTRTWNQVSERARALNEALATPSTNEERWALIQAALDEERAEDRLAMIRVGVNERRERVATAALVSLAAFVRPDNQNRMAVAAVRQADALIAELDKENT